MRPALAAAIIGCSLALARFAVAAPDQPEIRPHTPDEASGDGMRPHTPGEARVARRLQNIDAELKKLGRGPELVAEPVRLVRQALARAAGVHASGGAAHAALLFGLAEDWTTVAETTVKAYAAEQLATQDATRARSAREQLARARALLTEEQARVGRLQAQVKAAETRLREQRQAVVEAERTRPSQAKASPGAKAKP